MTFFKKYALILSRPQRFVLIIVMLLAVGSIFKSYHYVTDYGNIDLRIHVVGGRLLFTKESPYFFKWSLAYSDRFLTFKEVNENGVATNGVTQAPGFLYFQSLFNNLNYRTIQFVWMLCQYILIGYILSVFLLQRYDSSKDKFLAFSVAVYFFLCSSIWFINIERGQSYILFAVVFCVLYQLYCKKMPLAYFFAGALVAVAAYSRPNFIIVALPMLIAFNRWTVAGLIAAAIPLAIHAWFHLDLWKEYNEAMAFYTGVKTSPAIQPQTAVRYPAFIEGINANLISKRKVDFQVGGILPVMQRIESVFGPVNPRLSFLIYGICMLGLLFLLRKPLLRKEPANIILCGFLLYILFEYTMPVGRGAYTLIQWVFPVLLMLQKRRFGMSEVVLLIAGLCFITDIPTFLPYFNDLGELLLVILTVRYIQKKPIEAIHPEEGTYKFS